MEQKQLFFSIVIPAHNEEKYIKETLQNITNLNYPKDKFEVIVVENGSTDKTLGIAKKFEKENIRIFSSTEKGVSRARNFGVKNINQNSDWAVFLDADTILKNNFLDEFSDYLNKNVNKNFSIGTTEIKPYPESTKAVLWYKFYDFFHEILKASYSVQIIKSSILDKVKYDESMERAEDLKMIKDARKYGKFFFFKTKNVFTSTRRFTETGWLKLLFIWVIGAISPFWRRKNPKYVVIR